MVFPTVFRTGISFGTKLNFLVLVARPTDFLTVNENMLLFTQGPSWKRIEWIHPGGAF